MSHKYLELMFTDAVRAAQARSFGREQRLPPARERDVLRAQELEFIHARDSFYMGSVSETGWPYIQHRGGKRGFLRALGAHTLGFADYQGNRQLISTGNLSGTDRVAMFLMDYPARTRLKLLGHARILDPAAHPAELEQLCEPEDRKRVERLFLIDVIAFDWNCPKYITPRFAADEVQAMVEPLRARIAELEDLLQERPIS
jgi:predicted pyridoxine 5'-phosphate oxidase superfamily flavin-nucleotide-binding protein